MNKTYQQFSGDKTTGWRNNTELENGKRASENRSGKWMSGKLLKLQAVIFKIIHH